MDEGGFSVIHCHTPVGGVVGRLAARKARKKGTRVIYTAHGFHFYKGAPIKNWLLYYPVERICSHLTDILITINKEDFALAQKKMKAKCVEYVPGVGVDLEKFSKLTFDKAAKRRELGIPEDAVLLLSVGELNENKNHETVIRAIADMDVYYIIAGKGDLQKHLQNVIDMLGARDRVKLLGYRCDVDELYKVADIFAFPSFREGLPVSVMEAMAAGVPVVASRIRGNVDLIQDGINGFLCDPSNAHSFADRIRMLLTNDALANSFSERSKEKIKKYDIENVLREAQEIYKMTE
jgi:glycosyltransferase EpsD